MISFKPTFNASRYDARYGGKKIIISHNLREFCGKLPSSCSPAWGTMGPFCWDLLRFRWLRWIRWKVVDPLENSQRAPMIVKTQYTGPFFPENGHGNLCLTMDILRNPKNPRKPKNPRNPRNPRIPRIPWLTMDIHG